MRILELFSGTESFSKVAEARGHQVFTIDVNPKFNPSLCKDVLLLKKEEIPFAPDLIWASPPCTEYSHAKRRGVRDIEGANKNVLKAIEIIKIFKPKFWIIENPQTGLLKNQDFMKDLPFVDASYCKYGLPYRKQTRFWTNLPIELLTCNKDCDFIKDGKHLASAGNGRKKYTDRNVCLTQKYAVPEKLCLEILQSCEQLIATPLNSKGSQEANSLNISLKDNSNELSQISSNDETSLNNNIKCNMNKSLAGLVQPKR